MSAAEIESHAHEQDIMFIETSAKEGFNIKLLFRRLATALPNLEASADGAGVPAAETQVVQLTAKPAAPAPGTAADGKAAGCAAGCY